MTDRRQSGQSGAPDQAPLLWRFDQGASAYGVFADERGCFMANQEGRVYELSHEGELRREVRLPRGVRCLVGDEGWLYAGCADGRVYDVTGRSPHVVFEVSSHAEIYWLDIVGGVLAVSDVQGNVLAYDHESEELWSRQSQGREGWMVRADRLSVYHGHARGVTAYLWATGEVLWHRDTPGGVLFGWQGPEVLYAATDRVVLGLTKEGGRVSEFPCDATIYSCAASPDGRHLFAADSSSFLYCFDANGGLLWKLETGCGAALSMHPVEERLYLVTGSGALACVDARPAAIEQAREGYVPAARTIRLPSQRPQGAFTPAAPARRAAGLAPAAPAPHVVAKPSAELEVTRDAGQGVVVECYKEGSRLRVRVVSEGYREGWHVQFPRDVRVEGARYVVDGVRESSRGGFYRAFGAIRRLEP